MIISFSLLIAQCIERDDEGSVCQLRCSEDDRRRGAGAAQSADA